MHVPAGHSFPDATGVGFGFGPPLLLAAIGLIIFLFNLYIYIYIYIYIHSCVVLHILHCPLSGPDMTYISLLILSCIIQYVTNKKKT